MGSWGHGIEEGDTVLDIVDAFVEALRETQDVAQAAERVRAEDVVHRDPDEMPQVRIGLALALWRYGADDVALRQAIADDLAARRGIDTFREPAPREQAVREFLARIARPNPRPKALPKPRRKRKPKPCAFPAGACLAIGSGSASYRGAVVLVAAVDRDGDGYNIIGQTDWRGAGEPDAGHFARYAQLESRAACGFDHVTMYPHGPYAGRAAVRVVAQLAIDPAALPLVSIGDGYWARRRSGASEPAVSDYLVWRQWDELGGALSF